LLQKTENVAPIAHENVLLK
jgi:hypothetical protein